MPRSLEKHEAAALSTPARARAAAEDATTARPRRRRRPPPRARPAVAAVADPCANGSSRRARRASPATTRCSLTMICSRPTVPAAIEGFVRPERLANVVELARRCFQRACARPPRRAPAGGRRRRRWPPPRPCGRRRAQAFAGARGRAPDRGGDGTLAGTAAPSGAARAATARRGDHRRAARERSSHEVGFVPPMSSNLVRVSCHRNRTAMARAPPQLSAALVDAVADAREQRARDTGGGRAGESLAASRASPTRCAESRVGAGFSMYRPRNRAIPTQKATRLRRRHPLPTTRRWTRSSTQSTTSRSQPSWRRFLTARRSSLTRNAACGENGEVILLTHGACCVLCMARPRSAPPGCVDRVSGLVESHGTELTADKSADVRSLSLTGACGSPRYVY